MDQIATLSALYESTRSLGLRQELDPLLAEILERAQGLVGFEHCALMLLDPERSELVVRRVLGYGDRAPEILKLRLRLDQGLSGWSATHRQAVRVDDVTGDPRYYPGLLEARSNLAVPLILHNDVIGVLNVESGSRAAFTEVQERLLTILGTQAALAIEAFRDRARLQQQITHLNALFRISQLAAQPGELDAVLAAMLDVTQEVVPDGYCAILLLDPSTRVLTLRAERGYANDLLGLTVEPGRGITGRCAQLGQAVIVDDLSLDPDYIPGVPGAQSELAVPMVADGTVFGVLNCESRSLRAYNQEHARTLSVIAHQAAVVLRAAQLHEEANHLAITDSLTGLHNRRHFVSQLEDHLRRTRRYGETLAVVFLDLDQFKGLNDRSGHRAGDRALRRVGLVIAEWVRDSDVAARIGGDEFAALLLKADRAQASQVVDRLRAAVEGLGLMGDGSEHPVTLSAGIALFPEDGDDAEALLERADTALYEAKRRGGNRVLIAGDLPSPPSRASAP
jgi:diguanylate cyclase (GGDEF)-like protein